MRAAARRAAALVPSWPLSARAADVELVLRFFYAALLWLAATTIYESRDSFRTVLVDVERAHWPAFWVPWAGAELGYVLVSALLLTGAFLGAALPHRRWARALACLGLWEYVAVMSSIGEIFPTCHQWVVVAFIFALAPDRFAGPAASEGERDSARLLFWAAQAFLLLTYSMAGLSKFLTAAWQTAHGEPSIFTALGCLRLTSDYIAEGGRLGPLGLSLRDAGLMPAAMFAVAAAELVVVLLAFRARLHVAAGAAVVAFHAATYLIMGIYFKPSVLLAGVLLFCSPFSPREEASSG